MSKDSVILGIVLGAMVFLTVLVFVVDGVVPDAPTLDYPKNESELQDFDMFLIVKVNDDDDDWLNITFYNVTALADTWQPDTAISGGLGDVGIYSSPTVFQNDSTWYLISGEYGGGFYGYNWTGSTWQADTTIASGLGDVGAQSAPAVFHKDSTWYLISGESEGVFYGYNWTGSTWQADTTISSGLGDVGGYSSPAAFQKDGTWYLISGENDGNFNGYNWTGTTWQSDTAISSGLGDVGTYSSPAVFQKDSTWYLISGGVNGVFFGYNWTGATWQSDTAISSGLGDVGAQSAPAVFQKDSIWYLISGENDGVFYGHAHVLFSKELISWNDVNGSGKAACVWKDLEYGNTYEWYANASDASDTTQSNTFTFSLVAATPSEKWADSYIEPEEGLGWASIENSTQILEMTLQPYLITMGAWFYAIFVFAMVGLIYIKSQKVFLPSVILLLSGITMASILPGEIYGAAMAMIALGFTGVVYVAFHRRL